ncbi:flagellar hook assembly protein FlgD [Sutcliffiella rhizosphaerae]|uniref:Basal-body rod modification protein FlgD n=1 Tax=Sutcliffiella rhizosphaerae TaxID=2880967 RepID=A0ABM8YIK1_9BACI|nr:flagellar hook assembly protein FlgD [Sutcliffiella rhizosphaerae]CAG9619706.1 hypothetical protein BACCIP111883_00474 [Sutcliffiella rhizosphaerae]
MTNTISSDLFISNRQTESQRSTNIMGKDDFLRLLIAQLQNQDPLNPMEDREFIAQMANFSSLEQMTNLNKSMEGFISNQNKMNVLSLQQYLGVNLSWQDVKEVDGEMVVETKSGFVSSISMVDGKARLVMNDGSEIAVEQITKVKHSEESLPSSQLSLLSASHLIGKKVSVTFDGQSVDMAPVESVLTKDGKTYLTLNNELFIGKKIPLDAITRISQ